MYVVHTVRSLPTADQDHRSLVCEVLARRSERDALTTLAPGKIDEATIFISLPGFSRRVRDDRFDSGMCKTRTVTNVCFERNLLGCRGKEEGRIAA